MANTTKNTDVQYSLTSTYTTQEFMTLTGIKHPSVITRMIRKGVLAPDRIAGKLHFNQADVERYADYKESPYKDQTTSKFEKLVLRVEQLEQEVSKLKSLSLDIERSKMDKVAPTGAKYHL